MRQNIYDNESFAMQYDKMRKEQKGYNANDLIEIPNFRNLIPNVKGKRVLDLGCGYGENSRYCIENGALYVLGIDISKHMLDIANKENLVNGIEELEYNTINIFDPETNIHLGTNYISELLRKYNNVVPIAVAAYNAGIGNVDKWIENGTIKEDGSNIENIPFKETNIYVRKVLRDYKIFKEL